MLLSVHSNMEVRSEIIRCEEELKKQIQAKSSILTQLNTLTLKFNNNKKSINNLSEDIVNLETTIKGFLGKIQETTNKNLTIQLDQIKIEMCAEDEKNNMNYYANMMEEHKQLMSNAFPIERKVQQSVDVQMENDNAIKMLTDCEQQLIEYREQLSKAEAKCAMLKKRNAATVLRMTKKLEGLQAEKNKLLSQISANRK